MPLPIDVVVAGDQKDPERVNRRLAKPLGELTGIAAKIFGE